MNGWSFLVGRILYSDVSNVVKQIMPKFEIILKWHVGDFRHSVKKMNAICKNFVGPWKINFGIKTKYANILYYAVSNILCETKLMYRQLFI